MDNDFILLDDLVYAPLHALAVSNHRLWTHIIETIKSMGKTAQSGQEEVVHLNNINIAYDQIRSEGEDGYSVDNLQVQVPLLSIVPVTNLNVEKAEIGFSSEIKTVNDEETGETKISARICSPSQRESDFLPKVSYKLHISSTSATEGLMRLVDALSANQVAKKLDTRPVAVSGDLGTDEQRNAMLEGKQLKAKVNRLKKLYAKVSDMMVEQERLHQISADAYQEDTYEYDRQKYLIAQSKIVNRIMEYQERIIGIEVEYGLEKDYE